MSHDNRNLFFVHFYLNKIIVKRHGIHHCTFLSRKKTYGLIFRNYYSLLYFELHMIKYDTITLVDINHRNLKKNLYGYIYLCIILSSIINIMCN